MEPDRYITPEAAANTLLPQLSPDSRIIVTGQIGCGKTTLSEEINARLRLTHLHIDDFGDDENSLQSAAAAAKAIDGGWGAEANVWQIPQTIWELADLAIFLDYANMVHYPRIVRRCFRACKNDPIWTNIRTSVSTEFQHMKIVFLYANENREDWQKRGGITDTATPVIRCVSPRETEVLLAVIGTTSGAEPALQPGRYRDNTKTSGR